MGGEAPETSSGTSARGATPGASKRPWASEAPAWGGCARATLSGRAAGKPPAVPAGPAFFPELPKVEVRNPLSPQASLPLPGPPFPPQY